MLNNSWVSFLVIIKKEELYNDTHRWLLHGRWWADSENNLSGFYIVPQAFHNR